VSSLPLLFSRAARERCRAQRGVLTARARAQLLPRPMVKVQKRWRLGDTPVSLRLRYECPLEEVGRFYEPPARLLLRCARPALLLSCARARAFGAAWQDAVRAGRKCSTCGRVLVMALPSAGPPEQPRQLRGLSQLRTADGRAH
jgi:hypothetical protein